MALPTPKELKRLASACRAAGITSFKGDGIEFTLGDKPQPKVAKQATKVNHDDGKPPEEERQFSEEEMLLWSSVPGGLPVILGKGGDSQ